MPLEIRGFERVKNMAEQDSRSLRYLSFRVSGGGVGKQALSGCSALCFATMEFKK